MFERFKKAATRTPEFIPWREYYSVGSETLDNQHKTILALINRMYDGMDKGAEEKLVRSVFEQLVEYTKVHFAQEEELMKVCGYPDARAHKLLHEDLAKETLDAWKQATRQGGVGVKDALGFLKQWWVNHICGEDKKYAAHLEHAAGVRGSA